MWRLAGAHLRKGAAAADAAPMDGAPVPSTVLPFECSWRLRDPFVLAQQVALICLRIEAAIPSVVRGVGSQYRGQGQDWG